MMESVTSIIDMISYVLMAFVSVSLIVSSIMIGIITYISVLERTKEIGILRAIGASKKDISHVFNAEAFIIGLISGLLGIIVTLILDLPISMIVEHTDRCCEYRNVAGRRRCDTGIDLAGADDDRRTDPFPHSVRRKIRSKRCEANDRNQKRSSSQDDRFCMNKRVRRRE